MKGLKAATTSRSCYFCNSTGNPILLDEEADRRFGRPVMPEGRYRLARCRACRCLYVDSDVTDAYVSSLYREETRSSVKQLGMDHDRIVDARLPEFRRALNVMLRVRAPHRGDRLLDLGCQTGEFGAMAAACGIIPDGVELSSEYAQRARLCWGAPSQVYSSLDEACSAGVARYAYVSAFETLEHMLDPMAALLRLNSLLAPGGLLAISVPSVDYFRLKVIIARLLQMSRRTLRKEAGSGPLRAIPHVHIYTFSLASCRIAMRRAQLREARLGVTGWHGPLAWMNPVANALASASRRRILLAPSILLLAERR